MAISANGDLVTSDGKTITIRRLRGILPAFYFDNVSTTRPPGEKNEPLSIQENDPADPEETVGEPENELARLQSRCHAQFLELALMREELEAFKLSDAHKTREIDALTVDVDRWKRSDAAKAEELAAAHEELEERRRDSQELIAVREELRFSQSQTIEIRKWYDEQFRQLKSIVEESQRTPFPVQSFIAQADARAEMNIIETLQQLNENVQWSSIFMADRVIHNFQPRTTNLTEEQHSATETVTECIGQSLMNRLRSSSRDDVAGYLPIAFRACLIYHLYEIISSWYVDSGPNQLIREVYNVVQKLESQTISGRWRSLTYASISPTCSSNPGMFMTSMMDGLSDIVAVAGCAASTSAAKETISSKLRDRISFILTTAGQLTKSIMDALSADYRVVAIRPAEMLDERTMAVDTVGQGKRSRSQRVLCTTQLGLSKEVIMQSKVGSKKNTVTLTNIVKAKILPG